MMVKKQASISHAAAVSKKKQSPHFEAIVFTMPDAVQDPLRYGETVWHWREASILHASPRL
jgi:hypothetical protein